MRRPRLLPLAAVLALALAGCGASDEDEVRDAVQRFEAATTKKDYKALCTDVLAKELVARLRAANLPCEIALEKGLGRVVQPGITINEVKVRDDTALARITTTAAGQRPSRDTLRLVKQDGEWRVSALSTPQPPSPPRNLAGEPEQ